jgi:hypothetical protein
VQILLDFLRKKFAKLQVLLIRMGFNTDWDLNPTESSFASCSEESDPDLGFVITL